MKTNFAQFFMTISPADSSSLRNFKYWVAYISRLLSAIYRRLSFSNRPYKEALSSLEDFKTLFEKKTKVLVPDQVKPKIILLGPYHFKQPMWSVRASAAMPDLIDPIVELAEVHLITPVPNINAASSINKLIDKHGIHHHLLPANFNLMNLNQKNETLDALVETIKPSVVMNCFGVIDSGFDAVTCARRNKIKSVLRVPGNEVTAREKMTDTNVLNQVDNSQAQHNANKVKFATIHADKVMVMSTSEADRIIDERKTEEGVFLQIRGVDTKAFKTAEKTKKQKCEYLNVGFIGRLTLEKGSDILFETIEKLSKNPRIKFHIASPEDVQIDKIKNNQNVKFHGYVSHDNIPALMSKLDVLILPSYMEGRSQTMMEAMASGLPVLLQSQIHSACLPGMIHCDENSDTFVKALEMLSLDDSKLRNLSKQARQSALTNFDKNLWSNRMNEAFKQLLKEV